MTKYLTVAETAKLVRKALKDAFPGHRFSVRSKSYSGGASIDVSWIDGPTTKAVEPVIKAFEGADFDGMQDLKTYRDPVTLNGESVSFGADFIFAHREMSLAARGSIEAAFAIQTGEALEDNKRYRFSVHDGELCHDSYEEYGSRLRHQIFYATEFEHTKKKLEPHYA